MARSPTNVTAAALPNFPYPAAQALLDSSYQVSDLEGNPLEITFSEIVDAIRGAAETHHQTSITLRTANGVFDRNGENWGELRAALQAAGYGASLNVRKQQVQIDW